MRSKKRKRGNGSRVRVKYHQQIEHRPSFEKKRQKIPHAKTTTFSWLCLIQNWEEENHQNSRVRIVQNEKKEKLIIDDSNKEKLVADDDSKKEKEVDEEETLPECVKKFLKRKRQGESLSIHQRSALVNMIQSRKKRKGKEMAS